MNRSEFSKMLKFAIAGGAGLFIDMGLTLLFKEVLGFNVYIAHIIGFLCAVCSNYLLNKYWTFKERDMVSAAQFVFFLAVSFVGFVLSFSSLFVLYNYMVINFYLSKLISIGIVSIWNYSINRYVVFRDQEDKIEI
ncbi:MULTISPECIES: GtrA family protein [Sphingobacterium]|uniref:GtrA family protein n=1 Tax=Sphingobacterium TaxID=28453 RepID=UPI000E06A19E|nr:MULTISPECIES: GtrA family protein [Sphingobacterium]QQT43556.1 GtrA family protein [Sphingobacterium multivorum]SUI97946.1 GtrA-like protein [Sphingobacterium multivorum]